MCYKLSRLIMDGDSKDGCKDAVCKSDGRTRVRFADAIPQFSGTGNSWEWIRKLELVAKSQEINDLENFLPLFLTGRAFTVYETLTLRSKPDYEDIKRALTKASTIDSFRAYEEFARRKLLPGEAVDLYLADLTRLENLTVSGGVPDDLLKCAFAAGLSEDERRSLKAGCILECMCLSDVVERSRVVMSVSENNAWAAAAAAAVRGKAEYGGPVRGLRCSVCNQEGHLRRECPKRVRRCFVCESDKHLARSCPEESKNE